MTKSRTREHILSFISAFRLEKGFAPTVKEIAENCRITSLSVVQYHLDRLEKSGTIKRERNKSRSISTRDETRRERHEVPFLGVIAAGNPIAVPETNEWDAIVNRIEVPSYMTRGRADIYALQVRGNSMVDAMIADGDVVIMERPHDIKNGDVAAVWLRNEQEVTLKKVYFEGEQIRLQPCNPYMMPFYHLASNVELQGKLVGVIRLGDLRRAFLSMNLP
jgi:repressor LexA